MARAKERVNIEILRVHHEQIRELATRAGIPMTKIVDDLLQQALDENPLVYPDLRAHMKRQAVQMQDLTLLLEQVYFAVNRQRPPMPPSSPAAPAAMISDPEPDDPLIPPSPVAGHVTYAPPMEPEPGTTVTPAAKRFAVPPITPLTLDLRRSEDALAMLRVSVYALHRSLTNPDEFDLDVETSKPPHKPKA